MTDVFISYKRRWRSQVENIAQALRELEVDVWFDADLEPGSSFSSEISREIRTAKSVLACLSNDAFPHGGDENGWVLGEATIGRDRKVLVAVMLEPTSLDPPWNTVHVEDLTGFSPKTLSGDRSHWQNVLSAIGRHLDRPGLAEFDRATVIGTAQALKDWTEKYPADPLAAIIVGRTEALEHPGRAAAPGKKRPDAPIETVPSARAKARPMQPAPATARHDDAERDRSAAAVPPDLAATDKRGGRRMWPILLPLVIVLTASGLLSWQLGLGRLAAGPQGDGLAPAVAESHAGPQAGVTGAADTVGASLEPDRGNSLAATSTDNAVTEAMPPAATESAQGRIIGLRFEIVALALPRQGDLRGSVEPLQRLTDN